MIRFVQHWRPRLALLAAVTAIALAACGSSTPSPSASASPTAGGQSTTAPPASSPAAPKPTPTANPSSSATPAPPAPSATPTTSATPAATTSPTPTPAPASPSPTAAASCDASSVPGPTPSAGTAGTPGNPPAIALRTIAAGLRSPIDLVSPGDGTDRLFIVEQGGTIGIIEDGALLEQPFLDLTSIITSGGERGLLGLAFHPQYRCNGRFFVNYTDLSGDTVVAEYRVSRGSPDRADRDAVARLLHIDQPFANHNGGDLTFGPDGLLYVGMGDGGSGGDPRGNAQRLDTLLGKMLRVDVDHPSDGNAYGIPAGNCSGCPDGALPEIYAYGLRNPWRYTFDRATGDLWIGDVGQNRYEEIDHVTASGGSGANFGWNLMEGRHCFPSGSGCNQSGLTLPIAEYDHSGADCSVTGGYVYRGAAIPRLVGTYLFADYCSGNFRSLDATALSPADVRVLLDTSRNITSFGEDDGGELYVTDVGAGEILKIVPGT
jgi:glucose/arabinose dehydrogenase